MLLLITLVAVSLGWAIPKAREQSIAVVALEKMDCEIEYANGESTTVLEKLRHLIGEGHPRNVINVFGHYSAVSDAGLELVSKPS